MRQDFFEQLKPLCGELWIEVSQSSHVSARTREACNQTRCEGISGYGKDDRDCRSRLLGRNYPWCSMSYDYINLDAHHLSKYFWQAAIVVVRPLDFESHVTSVLVAEIAKARYQACKPGHVCR